MFTFHDDESTYTISLKCDPGHETGEPLSQFAVRPLTKAMANKAAAAAGPVPRAGRMIVDRITMAMDAARHAKLIDINPDADVDNYAAEVEKLTEEQVRSIGRRAQAVESEERCKLGVEELHEVSKAKEWAARYTAECLNLCLASVDGVEVADAESFIGRLSPHSLAQLVADEVVAAARDMAELSPKACVLFAEQYG